MSTIEDVAKLAGLSRTTVSRVINNHPYVSATKKKLVHEAMEQLGYVPNSSARSLRIQKTETVAVFIPRVMNPFFSQLIETLEMAAAARNYQLIVCQTQYSAKKELNYLNLLKTKQVDGVILASHENDWELIEPYLQYGPIVLCNEFDNKANVPMIYQDQVYGGYIATMHLIEQGNSLIGYCTGGHYSSVGTAREKGVKQALKEAGLCFEEKFAFRNVYNIEHGRQVFHWIKGMNERPTAIFTGSDEVAAGIISEAKKYRWNIPVDLAVIGFDNQAITEIVEPNITTVHQPVTEMAEKAMEVMYEKINSKDYKTKEIYQFPLKLIVRGSTVSNNLEKCSSIPKSIS
ncbi:LacI family DNA-binding transcriptional regulator [Metabacillus arenae]|uniref:LacI family DNA-binding transcriptional regulator n=1 Tax=Metabacillus arenae TaxID=2771434 RepID=A0A926NAN6_9BACI|nr:LacI family DNA-binding transcriptional regulator [Metabacillus arenae]MBD1380692.1 LacI family DNA-binding transcriptional regulator [Metabacillus arenae]